MRFNKYSAIYRNDNLEFTDTESVKGTIKDIKEYLKYELANQCMSDLSYEELVFNGKMILYLLEDIEKNGNDDNKVMELYYNPMGALELREVEENE